MRQSGRADRHSDRHVGLTDRPTDMSVRHTYMSVGQTDGRTGRTHGLSNRRTCGSFLQPGSVGRHQTGVSGLSWLSDSYLERASWDVGSVEGDVDVVDAVLPRDEAHGVLIWRKHGDAGFIPVSLKVRAGLDSLLNTLSLPYQCLVRELVLN